MHMRRLGLLALLVVSTQALSVVTRAPLRRTRACVSRSGSAPVSDLSVAEPSYNLALGTIAAASLFGLPGSPLKSKVSAFVGGVPLLLFGLFIAFQTTNVRFAFDDDAFSLVKGDLSTTGENVVVGGANRWAYKSFVNWDFFPSEEFPILVYFKENQTPQEMWDVGPGQFDERHNGQIHFFPAIANTRELAEGFKSHDCAKL